MNGGGGTGGTGGTGESAIAPAITVQPASQTITAGQNATFSVTAMGTAPLSYQWQNAATGASVSGATSSTLTISSTTTAQSGMNFRVVVTNSAGSATSNAATLTVNAAAPAATAPEVTGQPVNQTVTAGQSATFSVTATGTAPLSYQWQNAATGTNISGATSSSYTIASTTTSQSGETFQVVVSNSAGSVTSAAATLTVNSQAPPPPPPNTVEVLTYHNDVSRSGLNSNEAILTTTNVNPTTFGQIGTLQVTGLVDAEPLYVPSLSIGGATHNVVYVATEHDMLYAFDADTSGPPLWQVSMIPSTETTSDDRGCGQVTPEIGITSTPVIDLSAGPNGTIFVVTMSKDTNSNYHQRLHAIDLVTHAELEGGPTEVAATYPGNGTGSSGGTQTFNPGSYEERASLLLLNGTIYTAWTSHCDAPNYTSWAIAYNESTLQRSNILNLTANGTTQNGKEGGIWMAGAGLAADASGFIYFLVGNGTFDTALNGSGFPNSGDYGNSFMKLAMSGGTLSVSDYFAMDNGSGTAESESGSDTDLGSGGAMVLPDLTDAQGNTRHIAVGAGKDSNLYIVDRDNMGKFASNDSGIYQELDGALSGGVWSAPAYFNGTVYYGPSSNHLLAFPVTSARLTASPSSSSAHSYSYPGATPSVSSNGATNGIVWTLEAGSTGTLRAYNAANLASQLYSSGTNSSRDSFADNSNDKFVTPMIANGKVYVGTPNAVVVFGLIP